MRARRPLVLAMAALAVAGASFAATSTAAVSHTARPTEGLHDALAADVRQDPADTPMQARPRGAVPEDRYAPAGGCYVLRSEQSGGFVTRAGGSFTATADRPAAAPFHFQALDLGKYLLFGSQSDFLAAQGSPLPVSARPAFDIAGDYVRGTGDETLNPARAPVLGATAAAADATDAATAAATAPAAGHGVLSAAQPSGAAEWVLEPLGGAFTLRMAVDDHDPANPGPADPPIAGTLVADRAGALAVASGIDRSEAARFTLRLADGCATWPEIGTQIDGSAPIAETSYEQTKGYLDAHLHGMAFEFLGGRARCGRPWHPYGVAFALVDCPDHEPGGRGAVLEALLSGGDPVKGHDTVGWPTFGYWPRYNSLTHEQVYYTWLERAWRGGLRMYTNLLVDNGVLCEIYPYKKNSCNEMDGVRLQAQRLHELERYIDAQYGGPGRGWFRIVSDPFEARRVINAGKLAVVMGIEVSVPFDCGEYLGIPRCTAYDIDKRMQQVYDLGVRQMELTNKFDNALTGVTGDSGSTGVLVNAGNHYETGHFWKMQTCPTDAAHQGDAHDKTQYDVPDQSGGQVGRDAIFGAVLQVSGVSGAAPAYPAGPHCNVLGLTDLGRNAIDGLIKRGMIFDPDHMSADARREALDFVEARHYTGVVSSHSWADKPTYERIVKLGGLVTPHATGAAEFVDEWRQLRSWSDPAKFTFGIGYGSDVNGFSVQPPPRNPTGADKVAYPFVGFGGVVVHQQVSGKRTYDVNVDGVDHYGLYPDWIEDDRIVAGADGAAFLADMQRGPEVYLQLWERSIGIQPDSCRADVPDLSEADLSALHRGMTPDQVLAHVGQPHERVGNRFTYCADGGGVTVTFDDTGRLAGVQR